MLRCACLLFVYSVTAATQPAGVQKVATVEGITEYRLANGLRAVLFPDPTKSTTTVNVAYLAGSRQENYGETGMAHLLEHLMSYGSPKHPDAKAEQAARGASRNATTSFDRTTYFETFPATDENLAWALDLESDRMRHAFVRKDILDSQMSVVRNEWEAGENNPVGVLLQRVFATSFLWHNYGKTTIGARSDIEGVPIERLQAFYDRYYHPNNAVLIVAGKFEEARAVELIVKLFGPIPRSPQPIPATYTAEPEQDGERSVTLRREGDNQAAVLAYHVPAASHPDSAAVRVLLNALTAAPSGRLYQALVPTKKAVAVFGFAERLRDPGIAALVATMRKDGPLEEVRSSATSLLDSLANTPITKEEADRARAQILRAIELSMNDSTRIGMALAEAAAAGDWRLMFLERDWVRKVTEADLSRVAKAYFVPSNRTVGIFLPEEKPVRAAMPKPPEVESLVSGYEGDKNISLGEAFDPTPENIDRRTERGALPSGLRYALLSKQTRGATVQAVLALHYGDENSLKGRMLEAELTGSMLRRGTAKHTRQQIEDELGRLKARLNASASGNTVQAVIEATRTTLPDVLRLASEVLRTPSFQASEFDQVREEFMASAESQRREPQSMAQNAASRHFAPYPAGDPRAVQTAEERLAALKAMKVADVMAFHHDFYGASSGELAVVGDFDAAAVKSLASELLGAWKSPAPFTELRRVPQKPEPVNRFLEAPDKQNAFFLSALQASASDEHSDYPALVLATYMMGGHSASRLYTRIRAKEGLSYAVVAQLLPSVGNGFSNMAVLAIAAPQNVPKVEAAFRDEMARALKEGFSVEETQKARSGLLQSRAVARANDAGLAATLQSLLRHGRTMAFEASLARRIDSVTPQQATEVLRKYADPAAFSIFKAGDFKRVGVTQGGS